MAKRLDGQTAIVTGAGRGIGRAIARELAATGANIVINYVTSADAANELANEIREIGLQALIVQADVTDYDQVTEMIKQTMDTFGKIDILVNNAGITRDKTLKNMTKQHWDDVIHVNLSGLFNCTQQVLPFMLERKSGRIVNISSFVALAGNIGQSNYATTKAGIIGFTKSVALEVSRYGITVNAVCPGFTETDMLMNVPEKIRERILEKIPMGRFGQPEEIASCVRYIVTEGDYMTAQAISINGGVYV
ncbi:MAG TPA: 3-oxoacyl-[acyl-carrier-protein] reductase [Ktedonobacteraceae bacterium]|nr:3-oxoacyl-[acyl-carrier-protein] reductase [Ktedonobacteraceae bacterium]